MKEPTPELVRSFYDFMTDRFRSKVVDKTNAIEMQVVAFALGRAGVVDQHEFLRHYATTIGRRVYTPYEVGIPSDGWDLWSQIVVCAHKHQHIVQYDEAGPIGFTVHYLGSNAERSRYEADALRTNMELHFWRYRQVPSVQALASGLQGYGLNDQDVSVAETILRSSMEPVRRGAIVNYASRVAIDWLNGHAADLRVEGTA